MSEVGEIESGTLPAGVRSRFIDGVNGLRVHLLEAGVDDPDTPCVLLLHGFPELAFSWRKVMQLLAAEGFYVVAPDQRGYGRTTGWSADYDTDLAPFHMLNLVSDAAAVVAALGREHVSAVVGHDFGSPVAAYCALTRPDVFYSVALMSAPFDGPPALPVATTSGEQASSRVGLDQQLASLVPPRKHYQRYFSTPEANTDMLNCRQGLSSFLRAYFHSKSADWAGNDPIALKSWAPEELAKMPDYYIMNLAAGMSEAVEPFMPSDAEVAKSPWLPDEDLQFYAQEFRRTGFQGGLNWYRCRFRPEQVRELSEFHGQTIDVPACFIAGEKDWGVFQKPHAFENMQNKACSDLRSVNLVEGAGHWVQQEQPEEVTSLLLQFFERLSP